MLEVIAPEVLARITQSEVSREIDDAHPRFDVRTCAAGEGPVRQRGENHLDPAVHPDGGVHGVFVQHEVQRRERRPHPS